MKKRGLILAGLMLVMGSAASAETIEVESKIEQVVVFPNRALVTRTATFNLPDGSHTLRLSQLPGTIEEDSLSAKGKGAGKVTLFGAKLVRSELAKPQSERVLQLVSQLQKLKQQKQKYLDEKNILQKKENFLASIEAATSEQVGKDLVTKQPSINDIVAVSEYLNQEYNKLFEKHRILDEKLHINGEEFNKVQRELKKLHGETNKQKYDVLIDVEAEDSASFRLEVSYRLPGATWSPLYEARTDSEKSEVKFTSFGLIKQRTGESWNDVEVFLSTAKPSIGGNAPEMFPWYLRKRDVYYAQAARKQRKSEMAYKPTAMDKVSFAPGVGEGEDAAYEAEEAVAAVETGGPSVIFKLPKRETILNDWQPRKVAIAATGLKADFIYQVSPKLSPHAFLTSEVTNNTDALFLAGPVQVFLDGAFVGKSFIKGVAPGEKFTLSLGIDERVKAERKELSRKEDVSTFPGFHGKIKSIDFKIRTIVENFHSNPVKVMLVDQLPVPQHDEIKIKDVELSPSPGKQLDDKPGVREWVFTLKPREKKEFDMRFEVSHPVDFIVEGL